jgi:hypothetical protein
LLLNPSITALVLSSILVSALTLAASVNGIRILVRWDRNAGTEEQVLLESRTYFVSTSFAFAMLLQVLSLVLLVNMAERAHILFDGAMCAAGTFNVNLYGFPMLVLKAINTILCSLWIVLNLTDNRSVDQPLIRFKYAWVPVITMLILMETYLQFMYFLGMDPDIITSCCGTIFNENAASAGGDLAHLPHVPMKIVFYSLALLTLTAGARFIRSGKGALVFSLSSVLFLPVAFASIISFISPAIYELPTHHCPFCFMQKEYYYVGYPMYIALFAAGIAGTGIGVLHPFRQKEIQGTTIPAVQARLGLVTFAGYTLFILISTYFVLFTNLVM